MSNLEGYWKANTSLIRNLLIVWALVSYVLGILLAEPLNAIRLGGLPLGFWFAQQGSIYVFVILIFYYAWKMDQLDRQYGVHE
ncbi:hypothetical protein CSW23_12350 [Thermus scotoductus]|jgi:putative solute:sodium symporter small subunit|uniref:Sodium symporter small subunit domain-containing protein n=1 Tax=Thermus scotoductus TaxID=37636 RepID=A0A430UX58_THESC|nr:MULTISPECIES: DUF4212 domain-containing protein [Thermus]RTH97182.1 hypothetical protein CSW31_12575 [Thermus scotoductus]RTI13939.1 hypothetical protein CSW23_12350 [Thermus scotoductus]ULR41516.1 DUF4212 domain-containing protein [Thermus sp. NEB1569]